MRLSLMPPATLNQEAKHPGGASIPSFFTTKSLPSKAFRVGVAKARPASLTHIKERHMYENTFK